MVPPNGFRMDSINVLLIGSGAREHALAWSLRKSPYLGDLFCAPGNPGMATLGQCVPLPATAPQEIIAFCRNHQIGLVIIGPEAPLAAGLADALSQAGIRVFGPSKAAAQLEASKGFTKDLCHEAGIPTAAYRRFHQRETALAYIRTQPLPLVIKANGLAAGKGVTIAQTLTEAERAIDTCFAGTFGGVDGGVVIEEFLEGEEASFFALADGTSALPFATAQDYKRAFDGDSGPNTGGMGAISPAAIMTEDLCQEVMARIVVPTLRTMAARGTPFRGILYAGLMLTAAGPKLIEYNVRFGDPECQVLMRRLDSDLLAALLLTACGRLHEVKLRWHTGTALGVVMAAQGYPGASQTGGAIQGIQAAEEVEGVVVFQAGTRQTEDGLVASGGRVLTVTALGATLTEARSHAYEAVSRISWPGGYYRRDIGVRHTLKVE